MKITKEQFEYMKSKPAFQNEGIVGAIFNRLLKRKLSKIQILKELSIHLILLKMI